MGKAVVVVGGVEGGSAPNIQTYPCTLARRAVSGPCFRPRSSCHSTWACQTRAYATPRHTILRLYSFQMDPHEQLWSSEHHPVPLSGAGSGFEQGYNCDKQANSDTLGLVLQSLVSALTILGGSEGQRSGHGATRHVSKRASSEFLHAMHAKTTKGKIPPEGEK